MLLWHFKCALCVISGLMKVRVWLSNLALFEDKIANNMVIFEYSELLGNTCTLNDKNNQISLKSYNLYRKKELFDSISRGCKEPLYRYTTNRRKTHTYK